MTTATTTSTKVSLFFGDAEPLIRALSNGLLFAGGDFTLPALTTIKFEFADGKLTTVSTDRYRLCIEDVALKGGVDWTGIEPFEFMLQRDDAKDLLAGLKTAKRDPITLTYDASAHGRELTVTTLRRSMEFSVDKDHSFPPYKSLIPDDANRAEIDRIGFTPAFLADLGKVQTGQRKDSITIEFFKNAKTPTRIQFRDGPMVILMPVRLD